MDYVFGIYLLGGIGIAWWTVVDSMIYIPSFRNWVHTSGWRQLNGGGNPEDGPTAFGPLVPMLLVVLAVFSFVHTVSGKNPCFPTLQ